MKYRKKPVIVEAFQMTRERRVDNSEWPHWMHSAWQLERETPGSLYPTEAGTGRGTLSIGTLEGQHLVSFGDWIVQGVKGELYPVKPDIFEATYEPVAVTKNDVMREAINMPTLKNEFCLSGISLSMASGEVTFSAWGDVPGCGAVTVSKVWHVPQWSTAAVDAEDTIRKALRPFSRHFST